MYTLVVDVRERALIAELARSHPDVPVTTKALDVGDVQVHVDAVAETEQPLGPRLVIERKTHSDLAASIKDGRWSEQKRRMLETAGRDRVAYVIEENAVRCDGEDGGALPSAWAFVDDGDGESTVSGPARPSCHPASQPSQPSHPRHLEDARASAAVLSLQVGYRLPVLFTRSVADTAELLVRIGTFLSRPRPIAHGTPYEAAACRASTATHSKKRENMDARQCFLQQLCQVPGVSHGIAVGIAATPGFGTMRDLARTLEALPAPKERSAALQKAPKVGKAIAERLLKLFSFA